MEKMTDKTIKTRRLIRKIALKNALLHAGKASEKAVIGKLLASDQSSYITGAVIPVDGGTTASSPHRGF